MNNCPKCGNPLQAGVTSCPICGTNISVEAESKQVTVESVAQTPAPAAQPAAEAATTEQTAAPIMPTVPAPPEPKEEVAPAAEIPVVEPIPVVEAPTEAAPAVQPAAESAPAPETATIQPTVQPTVEAAPVAEAKPAEVTPTVEAATPAVEPAPVAEIKPTVEAAPATEPAPVATTPVAPTPAIEPTTVAAPITPSAAAPVVTAPVAEPEKPKKKKNKLAPLLLLLVLVVGGAGAYFYFFSGTKTVQKPVEPAQKNISVATKEVIANGFDFKIAEGWVVREDNEDVIIVNENETVYIKLTHSTKNIESVTETNIKDYLNSRGTFTDVEVKTSKINAKDTFVADGVYEEKPFQLYFIDGGTNLTLGVTVVYAGKTESKNVNEATVQELIGSISYYTDGNENMTVNNTYSEIFGCFNGVLFYQPYVAPENPDNPDNPENNPENNPTPDVNPDGGGEVTPALE